MRGFAVGLIGAALCLAQPVFAQMGAPDAKPETGMPVMVTRWERGNESGTMMTARTTTGQGAVNRPLHMHGLRMSVATPKDGITAPVVFVPSFAALNEMTTEQVKWKILVYNPGCHVY